MTIKKQNAEHEKRQAPLVKLREEAVRNDGAVKKVAVDLKKLREVHQLQLATTADLTSELHKVVFFLFSKLSSL